MSLSFTKMHGNGNDYIYINCFEETVENPSDLSVRLSDRHFGVGGDGIVLIMPSEAADVRMRMFNADGSEGKMCGNAIRCVGKYAYERGLCKKGTISVETASGIKTLYLTVNNNTVESVRVDMGAPVLEPSKIPVLSDEIIDVPVKTEFFDTPLTCVSMGNPHAVMFTQGIDAFDLEKSARYEKNRIFPEGVNTEFVEVIDDKTLKMRVWERGSGETLACGTGACAVVVAAILKGYVKRNRDIRVKLRGGDLIVRWDDETVWMTGGAAFVYDGRLPTE